MAPFGLGGLEYRTAEDDVFSIIIRQRPSRQPFTDILLVGWMNIGRITDIDRHDDPRVGDLQALEHLFANARPFVQSVAFRIVVHRLPVGQLHEIDREITPFLLAHGLHERTHPVEIRNAARTLTLIPEHAPDLDRDEGVDHAIVERLGAEPAMPAHALPIDGIGQDWDAFEIVC